MARVALVTQLIDEPSLEPALTVGTDDDATYTVDGDANFIEVLNESAAQRTITIETGGTLGGHDIDDKVELIPVGERRLIPLRDKRVYLRPTGAVDAGKVYVGVDTVASVTAGAFR